MANKNSIGASSKKNAAAVSSKRYMNFVHHKSSFDVKKVLPIVLIMLVLALVLLKFGVLDKLDEQAAAYARLGEKQESMAQVNAKLAGYDELADLYGRYSYGWMTDAEINLVNRMDVLALVESELVPAATVDGFAVNDNVLTLTIHDITLDEASKLVNSLEQNPLVESVDPHNHSGYGDQEGSMSMTIYLVKG